MFAVIDIETTGGSPARDRITEVAVFIYDGEQIVDEFVTLINPERSIPYHITRLTGISNEMVADAPRFCEIAKKLVEITDGRTFVAHNAGFDYGFIKAEFEALGYDYRRNTLCTVKLSRKTFPGHPSYSLGNICQTLGISISDRHRAAGDAMATVRLLKMCMDRNKDTGTIPGLERASMRLPEGLHPKLSQEKVFSLPEETGVYYLRNEAGDLIYVGKSNNIRQRVLTHLRNMSSRKSVEMAASVCEIDFEITGSELVALLLESDEIKQNKPRYNKAQRRTGDGQGLFCREGQGGYLQLSVERTRDNEDPLLSFESKADARRLVDFLTDRFTLCQNLTGFSVSPGPCFNRQIKKCFGACENAEPADRYNKRVKAALDSIAFPDKSFLIFGKGNSAGNFSIVKVLNGKYCGFGFFSHETQASHPSELADCIRCRPDTTDARQIIRNYLARNPDTKKVMLEAVEGNR